MAEMSKIVKQLSDNSDHFAKRIDSLEEKIDTLLNMVSPKNDE